MDEDDKGFMHITVGDFRILRRLLELAVEDDLPERVVRREVKSVIRLMDKTLEETIAANRRTYE